MGRYDDLDEVPRSHLQAAEHQLDTLRDQAHTLTQAGPKLREALGGDQGPPELVRAVENLTHVWGEGLQSWLREHQAALDHIAGMARAEQAQDAPEESAPEQQEHRGRGQA